MATKKDLAESARQMTPADAVIERMEAAGKGSSRKPRKTDEGDIKTARTTFICTPEKWEQLQALCTYYTITGQTIDGNRPTPNRLLNVAIDAYLKDHAADLEQYKAITGKLQKGKTAKK